MTTAPPVPPELRPKPPRKETPTKTVAFVVLLALLVGFGVSYFIGRHSQPAKQAKCSGQCILLRQDGADPSALSVVAGSFVNFAAADGQRHNLSLDDHAAHDPATADSSGHPAHDENAYKSGDFKADEAWRVQFKQDGAYSFTDKYNPKIHVDIVVYTAGKDYKIK